MALDVLDNTLSVKLFNGLKFKADTRKFAATFAVKSVRENLETLSKRQEGGLLHIYAVSREKRTKLAGFVKITDYTSQKCKYESRKEVKELRAAGVEADHTVVKNEVEIAPHIWYNENTKKYKVRFPVNDHKAWYFIDGKEVSASVYYTKIDELYPPTEAELKKREEDKKKREEGVKEIQFRSLMIENILCIN